MTNTGTEYTIHELVLASGLSARTIHYYVKERIISPPIRTGGRSRYTEGHLDRLLLVKEFQKNSGMKLSQIKDILRLRTDDELKDLLEKTKGGNEEPLFDKSSRNMQLDSDGKLIVPVLPPSEERWSRIHVVDGIEVNVRGDVAKHIRKRMEKLIEYLRYDLSRSKP